jgi:hypothetical protein
MSARPRDAPCYGAFVLQVAAVFLALAPGVQPLAGESVSGQIAFPRPQKMSVVVGAKDRVSLRLGFDGRCKGGGIGELWMSYVPARQTLKVRSGAFSGRVTGVARGVGGRDAWTGHFTWRVSGRFTDHEVASATVSGSVIVRSGGKAVSRCDTARPAGARLRAAR